MARWVAAHVLMGRAISEMIRALYIPIILVLHPKTTYLIQNKGWWVKH